MKLALKLILILAVSLAGVYAATPLWLPYVLAGQLPPGWQLTGLKSGFPRPAGIRLNLISIKGPLGANEVSLTATNLNVVFRNLETAIDRVSADIFLKAGDSLPSKPVTLDDLPVPIEKLTGRYHRLAVNRIDIAVHLPGDESKATTPAPRPVMLDLEGVELTPSGNDGFLLSARLSFEDSLRLTGNLEVQAGPDFTRASLRFPSGEAAPWLDLRFDQKTADLKTTTRVEAALDADAANRDWLDSVLARSTRRTVTQFGGKLKLHADFSGQGLQGIDRLALTSENLHLLSDTATLKIDANLRASRQHDTIGVELGAPVSVEYQGEARWLDELIGSLKPGLRLPARSQPRITSRIASGSGISITTGSLPSATATADIEVAVESASEHFALKSTGLQIALDDLHKPESTRLEGVAVLDWKVDSPVAYSADGLDLAAEKIGISATVTSRGGKLSSTGNGVLTGAASADPVLAAEKLDLAWRDLDLEKMTGKLTTRTQGFSAVIDDQAWKGFDLDMSYALLKNNGVKGSGKLLVANGPELPLEFSGNTESMTWDVNLAATTVKLAKLRSLLSLAHVKLPAEVKLTEGYIEMRGDIHIDDDTSANMHVSGHDMVAALHESRIVDAGFDFDLIYDKTLKVAGPLAVGVLELAGGIDVSHVRAELYLEGPEHFELKNVFAEVFDGQLELGSAQYSAQQVADTTVDFTHLNLEKLLKYADVDGLQGTGFLDISLPVGSDPTGLHIRNGRFGSTGPGRLAYAKQGLAASNIGLKALENFQFKDLSGTFNYQSDGNYLMNVRLDGKNPDLYGGHPVVFNLNINGLLPAVFESMFVTGSFEESILKEIKKR